MSVVGFQFEVTSRSQRGAQMFVVAATTQSRAEKLLLLDRSIANDSMLDLKRLLTSADIEKYGLEPGTIRKIR